MAKTDNATRVQIPLINSINTDNINEDIKTFGDSPDLTPHVANTGIERNGGITNIYETEVALPTGNNFVTQNDEVITLTANGDGTSKVSLNSSPIGMVSSYGVESNITISGVVDTIALGTQITPSLPNGGYMTLTFVSGITTVTLYNTAGVQQATKSTTFTGLGTGISSFTSISFSRAQGLQYNSALNFILRIGSKAVIINEANPSQQVTIGNFINSTVLGAANAINTVVVYGNYLVVAGANGRVGSFDGTNWVSYLGVGGGLGPFNAGTAIMANSAIQCSAVLNGALIFGGVLGKVCYFDGSSWHNYNETGAGTTSIANNGTAISTNTIFAMTVYQGNLVVAGGAGLAATFVFGTGWVNSGGVGADTTVPSSNGLVIGANQINSLLVDGTTLVYSGGVVRLEVLYLPPCREHSPLRLDSLLGSVQPDLVLLEEYQLM